MSERPVLIPTAAGPVGGIVHEPAQARRGALVLLQGLGPSARAGVNAFYTRIARDLAGLGLTVLRFDLACEGDSALAGSDIGRDIGWRRSTDLAVLREAVPWFLARAGEDGLLLAGNCHGARVALEFAAFDPTARGLFLVVPYFWHREPYRKDEDAAGRGPVPAGGPVLSTDEDVADGLRAMLGRGPAWILLGEGEDRDSRFAPPFTGRPNGSERSLELEVAPGMPLHPGGHPAQQATIRERLVRRVGAALAEREQAAPVSS